MPSGWHQIGGYTGITLVLENWGVKIGGGVRPETQAHDLRDMLLLKSMYFRFYSVYSIGIPLFLENKSYSGIPTQRS